MKKIILSLGIALSGYCSYAQTQWVTSGNNINNTNTGDVGVGTSSPNAKLEVLTGSEQLRLSYDATHYSSFATNSTGALTITPISNITLFPAQSVRLLANTNPTFIIDGPTGNTASLNLRTGSAGSISNYSINAGGGSVNNLRFINNLSTNTVLTLNGDHVGAGITAPLSRLHVFESNSGNNNSTGVTIEQAGTGNALLQFLQTSVQRWTVGIDNANGQAFKIATGAGLGTTDKLTILTSGYVGIGTSTPQEALSVNGNIRSKQIKVELTNWPDYVFKPTYTLPALKVVKAYIEKNQHLPDIPSEQEVKNNGINLGEMVKLQTKKIEELTLYAIEQQKQIDEIRKKDEARVAALERALLKLTSNTK